MDSQPDKEMNWIRSRRILCTGVSIPVELGFVTFPLCVCVCVHQLGNSLNLYHLSHISMIIFHFQALFSHWKMRSGTENSKLLSMAWSF